MKNYRTVLVVAFLLRMLGTLIQSGSCCYITNCPTGGKRSSSRFNFANNADENAGGRMCPSCGSKNGRGICYGSGICCDPQNGCVMSSHISIESYPCYLEQFKADPCTPPGLECGHNKLGRCSFNGICCLQDGCFRDKKCGEEITNEFYQ